MYHVLKTYIELSLAILGVIKFDFKNGFTLKIHAKRPELPLSPVFVDYKALEDQHAIESLAHVIRGMAGAPHRKYLVVVCISDGAMKVANFLATILELPLFNMDEESFQIEGSLPRFQSGQEAIIIGDVITTADSKIAAMKALATHGVPTKTIYLFLDRQQGGMEAFIRAGYTAHVVTTIENLVDAAKGMKVISSEQRDIVWRYIANNRLC